MGNSAHKISNRELCVLDESTQTQRCMTAEDVAAVQDMNARMLRIFENNKRLFQGPKGDTGDGVNLQNLLISLFPDEWENFCERIGVLTMAEQLPRAGEAALQRWASDRAQVLSRTVRGIMRYADALRVLARLEGVPEEEVEMVVASKFEYVVTCQIYGKLRASAKPDDVQKAEIFESLEGSARERALLFYTPHERAHLSNKK